VTLGQPVFRFSVDSKNCSCSLKKIYIYIYGLGWWFGSLGIDGFVNLGKNISNPANNEIVENKENKFKTTMIATRLGLFLN